MKYNLINSKEYKVWLADIKARVRSVQIKAVLSVNIELLKLYWGIGADIVARQKKPDGAKVFCSGLART